MSSNYPAMFQNTGKLTQKFYNSSTYVWCLLPKVVSLFPCTQENEPSPYNHSVIFIIGETYIDSFGFELPWLDISKYIETIHNLLD